MKNALHRGMLGLMLFSLYGCGLKGPLYFPTANKIADKHQLPITQSSTQTQGQDPSSNEENHDRDPQTV